MTAADAALLADVAAFIRAAKPAEAGMLAAALEWWAKSLRDHGPDHLITAAAERLLRRQLALVRRLVELDAGNARAVAAFWREEAARERAPGA